MNIFCPTRMFPRSDSPFASPGTFIFAPYAVAIVDSDSPGYAMCLIPSAKPPALAHTPASHKPG